MLVQSSLAAVKPTIMDFFDAPFAALRAPGKRIAGRFAQHAITHYRTHLSHLKTYRCACGAMGCMTCSSVGLKLYQRYSPFKATRLMAGQFAKCRRMAGIFNMAAQMPAEAAAQAVVQSYGVPEHRARSLVIHAQSYLSGEEEERRKKRPLRERFCGDRDGCYVIPAECGEAAAFDACDAGACDAGACDVGSCSLDL